ncbi:MAG: SulP family inorganic anion transporter [Vicingaceae bacterium]|nr:SulP family inorganic anion transporter [Vicingaceae bacterium]
MFANLKSDFPAGLVVFLVALPLCLGVALASTGRSDLLFSGIIAGIVGGIVVGSLSNSSLGVSGPAAGLVVIVLTAIEALGSFEAFLLAVVLSGIIQFVAGYLKAGIIGYFFPSSVIKGMLTAIGIILILKEIPHAFGYDENFMGDVDFAQKDGQNTFSELYFSIKYSSWGSIIISIISLGLLMLFDTNFMKRIVLFKFLPGALFVVLVGILLNYLFNFFSPELALSGKHLVELPVASSAQEFVGFFKFPDFSAFSNPQVYMVAVTLAIVASLETLLSVEATDKLDPHKRRTSTNKELKAQGVGNMISGLIGGLPITQVIVRSSANIDAGGKTKLGTIIHGAILLLSVIIIPVFLNLIPLASLAAILLMVGYKLAKPSLFKQMYQLGHEQFIPFIITVVAIVSTDLLKGIGIGMVVAVFYILRKNYKNALNLSIDEIDGKPTYYLTLSEEITFLNKASVAKTLADIPEDVNLIIDGSKSYSISYDVLENIQEFVDFTSKLKNITVETKGIDAVKVITGH